MDVALVKDAQHDVDRSQRRGNEDLLRAERILKCLGGPREAAVNGLRQTHFTARLLDPSDGIAERDAGREIERERDRRELARVIHHQRRERRRISGKSGQRHLGAIAARDVNVFQRIWILRQNFGSASMTT